MLVATMTFLAPHMGEAARAVEYPAELEYEDVEARAADADEVRSWLTHLGLAQHVYTFAAHEIDFEVRSRGNAKRRPDCAAHGHSWTAPRPHSRDCGPPPPRRCSYGFRSTT